MQNTFIWIVIFAGAAIALLGVFLAASERELKKKRQEVDELVAKLGDQAAEVAVPTLAKAAPAVDHERLDALQARNQELEAALATASSNLALSRRTLEELQGEQRRIEAAQSNAQWLQTSNDQLKSEIEELKQRVQASDARFNESASQRQDTGEQQSQLQAELASVQQQLAASQSQLREFDGLQQKLANFEAIEASHHDARQTLATQIADLEKELSASAEKLRELDGLRERLAESEKRQQALREESRQVSAELAHWQERVNQADASRRQLAELREPFDKLLATQAELEARQREFKTALLNYARLMTNPFDGAGQSLLQESRAVTHADKTTEPSTAALEASPVMVTPTPAGVAKPLESPKHRFGIVPALVLLAVGGALVATLWSTQTVDPPMSAVTASMAPAVMEKNAPTLKVAGPQPEPLVSDTPAPGPAPLATKAPANTALTEAREKVRSLPTAGNQARLAGTYEITQPSRVYAAPSELSQLIGDIEPGVKVNVVNGKDGWLEIHSKYGRPPGFIRRESARAAP